MQHRLLTLFLFLLAAPAYGQASLDALLDKVRDEKDRVSPQVFQRIAGYRSKESFETLKAAVDELRREWTLRSAYSAFGAYGGTELQEDAVGFLFGEARRHRREENQRAAAAALGVFGKVGEDELRWLVEKHKDDAVRRMATTPLLPLLGEEGTPDAAALILGHAAVDPANRAAIVDALSRCLGPEVDELLAEQLTARGSGDAWKLVVLQIFEKRSGPAVQEALIESLRDDSAVVRTAALRLLGARGNAASLSAVRKLLKTRDPAELREAIIAVGKLSGADERWVTELMRFARSKDLPSRMGAAVALVELRTEEAIETLHHLLTDVEWQVRVEAIQQVGNLRRKASVPILIDRLDIETGRLRNDVATVLRLMTGEDHGRTSARWRSWWASEGAGFRLPDYAAALVAEKERSKRRKNNVTVATFYGLEVVSDRVAFVLDTSGSMQAVAGTKRRTQTDRGATGPTRLDVAKAELERALRGLSPGVLFNVVFFETDVSPWQDELLEKDERALEQAVDFAQRQKATGGTNVFEALLAAFEDPRVDTIYVLSDGVPTAGRVTDPAEIVSRVAQLNRTRKVQIHTISIGQASGFLRTLAEENGGNYTESL